MRESVKKDVTFRIFMTGHFTLATSGCATLPGSDLPPCSNVSGYYHTDLPHGAECLNSRLWMERSLMYISQIGSVICAVAAGSTHGEWKAAGMQTPMLVEGGLWKTTTPSGIASQGPYDANFDARSWPKARFTTVRSERLTVEVYVHPFGPRLGNDRLGRNTRMAALKYRDAPDIDSVVPGEVRTMNEPLATHETLGGACPQANKPNV